MRPMAKDKNNGFNPKIIIVEEKSSPSQCRPMTKSQRIATIWIMAKGMINAEKRKGNNTDLPE